MWINCIGFHVIFHISHTLLDSKSSSISLTLCWIPCHLPFLSHLVLLSFGDSAKVLSSSWRRILVCNFLKFLINSLYPRRQTLQLTQAQCVERICLKETVFHRPRIDFVISYPVWIEQGVYCDLNFVLFIMCYIEFIIDIVLYILCMLFNPCLLSI